MQVHQERGMGWNEAAHQAIGKKPSAAEPKLKNVASVVVRATASFTSLGSVAQTHRRLAVAVYVALILVWLGYCAWMIWSLTQEYNKFVGQTNEIEEVVKELPAVMICYNHFVPFGSPKYTFREGRWRCAAFDAANKNAPLGGPCTMERYTGPHPSRGLRRLSGRGGRGGLNEDLFPSDGCVVFRPNADVTSTMQMFRIEAEWEGPVEQDEHRMYAALFLDPNFHEDDIVKASHNPIYFPMGRHGYASLEKISWEFASGYKDFTYEVEWQDAGHAPAAPAFLREAAPLAAGNTVTGASLFVRYLSMETLAHTEVRSTDLQSTITLAISSIFSTYTTIVSTVFAVLFVPMMAEELFFVSRVWKLWKGAGADPEDPAPGTAAAPAPPALATRDLDLVKPPGGTAADSARCRVDGGVEFGAGGFEPEHGWGPAPAVHVPVYPGPPPSARPASGPHTIRV
eukprot:tig00001600_g9402.t1